MGRILFPNEANGEDSEMLTRAQLALQKAKRSELNKRRTVPKRVRGGLTIFITPEQNDDPLFMKRFQKQWEKR